MTKSFTFLFIPCVKVSKAKDMSGIHSLEMPAPARPLNIEDISPDAH